MILALLGGSFDPFHRGHLAMVRTVLQRGLADRVVVVPANRSPHKEPPYDQMMHRMTHSKSLQFLPVPMPNP